MAGSHAAWRYEIAVVLDLAPAANTDPLLGAGIFRCPDWKVQATISAANQSGYGWNEEYMGLDDTDAALAATYRRQPLSAIARPSESALCGDGSDAAPAGAPYAYLILHPPSAVGGDKPSPPVGDRHRKGINLLFADLHAQGMRQAELMAGQSGRIDWWYLRGK